MRVHLVKEKVIQDFVIRHAIAKAGFRTWLDVLKSADWSTPENMKATFPATDVLGRGYKRVIFDIGGNKYRLFCNYLFGRKKCICLSAGSERMLNTLSFATKANSTQ